jgi:glc operon protein GlcG
MFMPKALSNCVVACAAVMLSAAAQAQPAAAPAAPPAPPPQYGTELSAEMAKKAVAAAEAEAKKNNWFMNIAVVGPSGHLLAFSRMDGAQYASIAIAQHKARTAATFRRPTKVFEDRVAQGGAGLAVMTLDDVIASEGGIPIIADGKLVGAMGCSGGTGQQDGLACQAGVNALK